MRFTGWKCKATGKIFSTDEKAKYISHLKIVREQHRAERKDKREEAEFQDWLKSEKMNITSLDQIPVWILNNIDKLNRQYVRVSSILRKTEPRKIVNIEITGTFYTHVSNSHSCPRNGVTNWSHYGELPDGYPGWEISVWFKFEDSYEYRSLDSSTFFKMIDIHTGSGGGGGNTRSYKAKMFSADWPALAEAVEKDFIVDKLKNAPSKRGY